MLSAVLSLLATALSPTSGPAAMGACVPGHDQGQAADSCELDAADLLESAETVPSKSAADADEPRFATPAVIDCRVLLVPAALQALVGECDGTPRDASYRTSRDPDSERPAGGFSPGRRERGAQGQVSACAGIPGDRGAVIDGPSPSHPMALFALPDISGFAERRVTDSATFFPTDAELRLLERPPRA